MTRARHTSARCRGLFLAGLIAMGARAAPPPVPVTGPDFCTRVQQRLAGTTLVPTNVVHPDFAAFKHSKTAIDPLTSHQFVLREPGARGQPLRVSCKVKTPDHLNARFGANAARDPGLSCRDINKETADRVYASLTPAERQRLVVPASRIVFEPDITTVAGSSWIPDFDYAYRGEDGTLHLRAKSLRVNWDDIWWSFMPDRFRGALYCHLVAPEYLRRLALGEARPPAPQH